MGPQLAFQRACEENAEAMLHLIRRCMTEVNRKDYPPEEFEKYLASFTLPRILHIIRTCHYYEVHRQEELVACGGLNRDANQEKQCYFTAVFVRPDLRGQGVGRALVEFLERDEWALDSRLIEVPSSKSAHGFYHKCGYRYRTQPPVFDPQDGTTILYKERPAPMRKDDSNA